MLKSINPATGREMATFAELDDAGIENAIAKAWDTRYAWRDACIGARSEFLRAIASVLRADKERFAAMITSEMGKPIVEAEAEVEKCAWTAAWLADNARRLLADEPIESTATNSYVRFQPLGVVLGVMPWNFPFWQVFRAGIPALMGGNVVLLKHASNVPQAALAAEEAFRASGFPPGVFQTLLIRSGMVERIISDRRVAAVTLTGSDLAGSEVAATAGRALKKSVLELGGSDPFIVLEDADLELAASVACRARNQNNGQSCIAAKRFIVVEEVADDFERRFSAAVAGLSVGDPSRREVQVGPLARADLVDDLEALVKKSIAQGAQVAVGGQRTAGTGYYYPPTVLTEVTREMPVFRQETFGPVAAVIRVRDADEAVAVANDCDYGLGANVWTGDVERGKRLAERIESGLVFVNGMVASDARLPFGGVKRSGFGRELSEFGMQEFQNIQTVWVGPAR
jgi:acyl-CoA reductase-like NAD-dependent aldehyde dehydrogenase